jgi:hypothetical protein
MLATDQPPQPLEAAVIGIDHGEWSDMVERAELAGENDLADMDRAAFAFM